MKRLDYTSASDAIAVAEGVPPELMSALINAESAWNPKAVSATGCTGLGQFSRGTGTDYGLVGPGYDNRADAALNMTAMARYLRDLRISNPTWRAVIGHYSGQGTALANYTRYGSGRALIAVIDALDKAGSRDRDGDGEE